MREWMCCEKNRIEKKRWGFVVPEVSSCTDTESVDQWHCDNVEQDPANAQGLCAKP